MKKSMVIVLVIILISFVIAVYFYPQMPDRMVSHWNVKEEVDGYMLKFWGLFLIPIVSVGLFLLFLLIPKIDPLKQNIEKFRKYFDMFIVLIIVFLFYIYLLTIFWNLDYRFNMTIMMIPALGILFYYVGILTENAERNWFIGIRTPWTLSNDIAWNKTNKLGGKLFKIAGIVALIGILFQRYALWFVLVPVIAIAVYTLVYSYFEYKKQVKK
jgi:uncharacterized membrane protein